MKSIGFHTILFHAVYGGEKNDRIKHPYLYISIEELCKCIDILIKKGFSFIGPDNLEEGFNEANKILLTFDDGYYNNFLVLDILEKYDIPAIFFLVKYQIERQQRFWWDVYFSHNINHKPFAQIYEDLQQLKQYKRREIEERLKKWFGESCFQCIDDFDRPMNIDETKEFAKHKNVFIGAHSASHEILTNLTEEEVNKEINLCKTFLEDILNKDINFISYPNGNFNSQIIRIATKLGFKYGITTKNGINTYRYIKNNGWLKIKRNMFPYPRDKRTIEQQINEFADIAFHNG